VPDFLAPYAHHLPMFGIMAGLLSLASLVLATVMLPLLVVKLPADYFVRERREPVRRHLRHRVLLGAVVMLKNTVGMMLLLAGVLLLFLPGQGLLTMLIGLVLTNFPGKYWLEQRLIRRPGIARTLNRVRARADKAPFLIPADP
jgi:archaellum biogenesis protein FlaJ (TadC family)